MRGWPVSDGVDMAAKRMRCADLYRRGVLAMLPAAVVSSGYSLLLNRAWALEPITERVMLLTPVDLSQQLLLRFGTYARPLALFGGLAIAIAIGGIISVVAGLHPRHAERGALSWAAAAQAARLLAALALLMALLGAVFQPLDWVPTLILVAVYLAGLGWTSLGTGHPEAPFPVPDKVAPRWPGKRSAGVAEAPAPAVAGRAAFLSDSARILGATAVLTAMLLIEPWYRGIMVHRRGGRLFAFHPPPPRRPGFDLAGLTPEVTPPGSFYYLTKNLVDPDLSADGWTLRVDGLVLRAIALTFDDLLALPARSQWVTQECVSNPVGGPLISTALFTGVPLRRVLLRAGLRPEATTLVMRAPDGHVDSIPVSLALQSEVLLAYGMGGAYLERAHGYPLRVLIPGSYGFKSVKWVDHLELVDHQFKGTWQVLGWTSDATVQTMARIDLARLVGSNLLVAGVAFAGRRGIRAVQVQVEDGPWQRAGLHTPPLSPLTWVQWRLNIPLPRGRRSVRLTARAVDGTGARQDSRRSDIYPAGATGYHSITVTV